MPHILSLEHLRFKTWRDAEVAATNWAVWRRRIDRPSLHHERRERWWWHLISQTFPNSVCQSSQHMITECAQKHILLLLSKDKQHNIIFPLAIHRSKKCYKKNWNTCTVRIIEKWVILFHRWHKAELINEQQSTYTALG